MKTLYLFLLLASLAGIALYQEPFGAVAETWAYDPSALLSPDPFSNDYYISFDSSGRFLGGHHDLD